MNWILEHLPVVLAVAGAISYWLKQRGQSAAKKEPTAPRPAQPSSMADADDAERARRIREEILKKISARRGGANTPTKSAQPEERKFQLPPLMRPPVSPLDPFGGPSRPVVRRSEPVVEPPPLIKTQTEEAVLLRQERLAQQMRELEAQRASEQKRATAVVEATRVADAVSSRPASVLREQLRNPRSVRNAVLLREVLGTPVGLR